MRPEEAISDIGIGLIGGYVGTKVMEPVSMKPYEFEPQADRRREDEVRPGRPFEIAARKATQALGVQLQEPQLEIAGMAFHCGRA